MIIRKEGGKEGGKEVASMVAVRSRQVEYKDYLPIYYNAKRELRPVVSDDIF